VLAPRLSLAVPALAADAIMVADALAATLAAVDLLPSVLALAVLFLHCRAESSKDSTKLNKTSARAPEWLAGVRNTGMAGHSGAMAL
jgi:hypothetical protein